MTATPSQQSDGERVFVVDRTAFFGGDWPQGFHALAPDAEGFLARAYAAGRFVARATAEDDPACKQWIPYCVLCCGDWQPGGADEQRGVFTVQRGRGQSEARLHGSRSIGLGGHVEPVDALPSGDAAAAAPAAAQQFFANALWRELREELAWQPPQDRPAADPDAASSSLQASSGHAWAAALRPRLLGIVNDDSTPVGRVHAGLVYRLDLPLPLPAARKSVHVLEITKMRGGFASLVEFRQLWQDPTRFESWSQFLIEAGVIGAMGGRSWSGPASFDQVAGREP